MSDADINDGGTSTAESVPAPEAGTEVSVASPAPVAATSAAAATATAGAPAATGRVNRRKVREGTVVSVSMDKTAVVRVVDHVRHRKYGKIIRRVKKLYAHDETNDLGLGDRVRVTECRPLSKLKRWRVVEVLERAK